jgi:isopentenyl phosphate kinase
MAQLLFLKLGGSLITDKAVPHTPRIESIQRLSTELAAAWEEAPGMRLVMGHGSGSFGHVPASVYRTRDGIFTREQWHGFVEVWQEAASLNHIVVQCLQQAGLPAMAFPASASLVARGGVVEEWEINPLVQGLHAGLLPVIYGDVIFDREKGGTIFSTEELFIYLAKQLEPQRILLAGLDEGVWRDFPQRGTIIHEITPQNAMTIFPSLGESTFVDVTGGMLSKVRAMLGLVQELPDLEVVIFSGEIPGLLRNVILGREAGTKVRNSSVV